MSDTQIKLGNALLRSLVDLKEKKGKLYIEDVGALFQNMASSLGSNSLPEQFLRTEIEKMAKYISHAMAEISSISLDKDVDKNERNVQNISLAGEELTAVVKATEKATNDILDAADLIQENLGKVGGDPKAGQAILDATTRIYDACNFQDITGQRITKVLATLEFLERKINNLKALFDQTNEGYNPDMSDLQDKRADAHLMHGPALDGPSQDEIDKLFGTYRS